MPFEQNMFLNSTLISNSFTVLYSSLPYIEMHGPLKSFNKIVLKRKFEIYRVNHFSKRVFEYFVSFGESAFSLPIMTD